MELRRANNPATKLVRVSFTLDRLESYAPRAEFLGEGNPSLSLEFSFIFLPLNFHGLPCLLAGPVHTKTY